MSAAPERSVVPSRGMRVVAAGTGGSAHPPQDISGAPIRGVLRHRGRQPVHRQVRAQWGAAQWEPHVPTAARP